MSELSKLLSRKQELNTWCDEVALLSSAVKAPSVKQVQAHLTEVDELLLPKAQKLLGKTKEVDPVSGAPRYGVQHCQKIAALNETMGQLRNTLEKLLQVASQAGGGMDDVAEDQDKKAKANEPAADAIYTDSTVFDTALGYKDSQRITKEEKTTLQRQQEIERSNVALDPFAGPKGALKKLLHDINTAPGGSEEFCRIISTHRAASTDSAASTKEGLKFLTPLMQNIVGHPDDEKLRLLRLQHPIVYQKFVCHLPALELLHAAGFAIRCDERGPPVEPLQTHNVGDEPVYVLGVHPEAGPLPANANVSRLFQLAHEFDLTVVAFLKEPSVEDITNWMTWFDALTAVKNACEELLAKC